MPTDSEYLEDISYDVDLIKEKMELLVADLKAQTLQSAYETLPVRTSDLMMGFQSAVSRANEAARSTDYDTQDIETMKVKDLEISIQAPVIESGHASDPVLMLPNIKSVRSDSVNLSLKFSIVSVPKKN